MTISLLCYVSFILIFLGCIMLMFTHNVIHACMYLLMVFFGVAGLYLTLNADFVAAVQLMVYVGGIVVLILFAIMLTGGIRKSDLVRKIPLMGNIDSLKLSIVPVTCFSLIVGYFFKYICTALIDYRSEMLPYSTTAKKIGLSLITEHVLSFELVSFLMLGSLVGAAILSRTEQFMGAYKK